MLALQMVLSLGAALTAVLSASGRVRVTPRCSMQGGTCDKTMKPSCCNIAHRGCVRGGGARRAVAFGGRGALDGFARCVGPSTQEFATGSQARGFGKDAPRFVAALGPANFAVHIFTAVKP